MDSLEGKLAELAGHVPQHQGNGARFESLETKLADLAARMPDAARHEGSEIRAMLDSIEAKFAELAGVKRQQDEDRKRLHTLPEELAKLKAGVLNDVRAELNSRDRDLSWLSEFRAAFATSDLRPAGQASNPLADERPIPQEDVVAEPLASVSASEASVSAEASPATTRSLAAKFAAMAAERGEDPRESAVANLYKWFASASSAAKASEAVAAVPRGRPKSKPATPTRELIRAAAQELVNIKNSEEAAESNYDPFSMKQGGAMPERVEEVHALGTLLPPRKDAFRN